MFALAILASSAIINGRVYDRPHPFWFIPLVHGIKIAFNHCYNTGGSTGHSHPLALDNSKCMCKQSWTSSSLSFREAFDEFTILADSWRYSQQYSSDLFFVLVDIDEDGMDAFQQVVLTLWNIITQYVYIYYGNETQYLLLVPFPFPFQMHLTTAPTYFHFPPSGKRKPEDKFDIARFEYYIRHDCFFLCIMSNIMMSFNFHFQKWLPS